MELTKSRKIYVVDADQKFTASLKKDLVEKNNHEVMVFTSCADCLNSLSEKPEIIILDNHLNSEQKDKESNMQLLDLIKRDYPDVHVIVLAKDEGYGTAMQTILHGAEQYLIRDENTIQTIHTMIGEF